MNKLGLIFTLTVLITASLLYLFNKRLQVQKLDKAVSSSTTSFSSSTSSSTNNGVNNCESGEI